MAFDTENSFMNKKIVHFAQIATGPLNFNTLNHDFIQQAILRFSFKKIREVQVYLDTSFEQELVKTDTECVIMHKRDKIKKTKSEIDFGCID